MHAIALIASIPWILTPIVAISRSRRSRSLDDVTPDDGAQWPFVSVVIPARNEERNIAHCVESVLASTYPHLEVIAVDDHSSDGTGAVLRTIASRDTRLIVVSPPELPSGWFGKQWACASGARSAGGEVLAFFDADTWQEPELLTRTIHLMRERNADMISVLGRQELGSFWERVLQPQVFTTMLMRYGGSEAINASTRVSDKVANGQCLIVRRDAYDDMGGHAAVRDRAAEDLAIAQRWFTLGKRCVIVMGERFLSTRMYTSLAEIRAGWGKNIFAAGREAMPFGAVGRVIFPFLLVAPSIAGLAPAFMLILGALGVVGGAAVEWAAIAFVANLLWWTTIYAALEMSLPRATAYAFLHPLGAALLLEISLSALVRGRRVRWKDREYVAA